MKTKFISCVLAVSLLFSSLVSVSAAGPDAVSLPTLSFNDSTFRAWDTWFSGGGGALNYTTNLCNGFYARDHYTVYTYSSVEQFVLSLNLGSDNSGYYYNIQPMEDTAYYGIRVFYKTGSFGGGRTHSDQYTSYVTAWLTDNSNHAIFCTSNVTGRLSKPIATPRATTSSYFMLSYEDLYNLCSDYNDDHSGAGYKVVLNDNGTYWCIAPRGNYVLGNESGLPYGAVGPQAVNGNGNQRIVPTNDDIVNNTITNWTTQTVGDGNEGNIAFDGCIYDSSSKTYYYDSSMHFTDSFNTTNYYSFSYTYNIEYTSITYIGATEEYTKTYDVYYELPDGRSSADLTKEELEQLNLEIDVINYGRGTDDTRLRSLYHFDGNTEDSSFWNYCTSFDWNDGASLTYLESNSFNGCLYLDELTHDFTLTLPSSLGSGDFTLDFRYYQSSTLTPQLDSYITVGGQRLMQLNGSHFLFGGGNYPTPVGNWNHLAIVRQAGVVKFYLNGVLQGSTSLSSVLSNQITFHFGTDQQTYKYLDEIRVTNFAVWTSNFSPSGVPYDTNLALILPTDSVPVADEYWDVVVGGNNILSDYGLDWWDSGHGFAPLSSSNLVAVSDLKHITISHFGNAPNYFRSPSRFPIFYYYSHYTSINDSGDSLSITSPVITEYVIDRYMTYDPFGDYRLYFGDSLGSGYNYLTGCLGGISTFLSSTNPNASSPITFVGDYTLSMVASDGTIGSLSFTVPNKDGNGGKSESKTVDIIASSEFNGYTFRFVRRPFVSGSSQTWSCWILEIIPTNEVGGEFVYLCLEEGTESTVTAEHVTSVVGIPQENLNTPTLAVRSDIPVTDWQIGGIRPTFAERGMVYAMVENGYITSLQIYSGYAWLGVDGRIWTGERWIPYSSYNVITLSDMYDIADASGQSGYEYIYTETGFWAWLQKWLMQFKSDLFQKLDGLGHGGSTGSCNHIYTAEVISTPTCTDPGKTLYTCSQCGDQFTEYQDALDHDYHLTEEVENSYSLPAGTVCPLCRSEQFSFILDEDESEYSCSCSECDHEWSVRADVSYGHSTYTCSRCGDEYIESNKVKRNLFEAIGDLLADTFEWITDKLGQFINSLTGLSESFSSRIESIIESVGNYPLLFGAFLAGMPEDLMNIVWFGVIALVFVLVWKKFFS